MQVVTEDMYGKDYRMVARINKYILFYSNNWEEGI